VAFRRRQSHETGERPFAGCFDSARQAIGSFCSSRQPAQPSPQCARAKSNCEREPIVGRTTNSNVAHHRGARAAKA